jgi:hypothetical protein
MVRLVHSTVHWRLRCIVDTSSSDDENTPPNVANGTPIDRPADSRSALKTQSDTDSTGTATPPWLPPGTSKLGLPKEVTNPPPSSPHVDVTNPPPSSPTRGRQQPTAKLARSSAPTKPHHVLAGTAEHTSAIAVRAHVALSDGSLASTDPSHGLGPILSPAHTGRARSGSRHRPPRTPVRNDQRGSPPVASVGTGR